MKPGQQRLDERVANDLRISRTKAAALILAGQVRSTTSPSLKPGQTVSDDFPLTYITTTPNVSRAGGKLLPAFTDWHWDVAGQTILDVGSSTGGFTEQLLLRGAAHVYAVDVGKGQLDWTLRTDPRVTSLEETDIRNLALDNLGPPPEAAVVDVSFISVRQILPSLERLLPAVASVALLFKPQFEVGKAIADRYSGVITDMAMVEEVLREFRLFCERRQWEVVASLPSPVRGTKGNQEHLLWLRTPPAR